MNSTLRVALISAAALVALVPGGVLGQDYPNRPIQLIVPFAPGGGLDIVGRVIAQKLGETFAKRGVLIDNHPGASATIGTELLARATPDGYTIGLINIALGANPSLVKLRYDAVKDFAPISLVTTVPSLLIVNKSLPVKSLRQFIALAKARPGELNFGSAGIGTSNHLPMALLMYAAGIKMVHVPYTSGSTLHADLISGQVQSQFLALPSGISFMKTGKINVLAAGSLKRLALLPDVPTVAESGVPGFEFYEWHGVAAPAGTPAAIVTRLNAEINKTLTAPDVKQRLDAVGAEIVGSTPEHLAAHISKEVARWAEVIKQSSIQGEK